LAEAGANAIWRVHPAPPGERLEALGRLAAGAARVHGLHWSWTPRHLGGSSVSELLDTVRRLAPAGVQLAIERAAMISNVRSTFTAEHGPHHGVGATGYARVSSPMREIVGVYTHALLLQSQGLDSWKTAPDDSIRDAVARAGNEGQSRQRRLAKAANRLVLDRFFERDLRDDDRPWRPGFVVELRPSRVYVLLDEPPFEVKVYGSDLGRQSRLDQDGARLRLESAGGSTAPMTEILLGQRVELRTNGLEAERWQFALRLGHDG
jgi:ribonuclease R